MTLRFREVDRDKFEAIVDGRKQVETRAATPKYHKIQPGDEVTFVCGTDKVTKTVKSASIYPDVEGLFRAYPIKAVLPGSRLFARPKKFITAFPATVKRSPSMAL